MLFYRSYSGNLARAFDLLVQTVIIILLFCFENMLCACEKHLYTYLQIKPSDIFSRGRKEKKKGVVGATLARRIQLRPNTRVLKNPCHSLVEIVYRRLLGVLAS